MCNGIFLNKIQKNFWTVKMVLTEQFLVMICLNIVRSGYIYEIRIYKTEHDRVNKMNKYSGVISLLLCLKLTVTVVVNINTEQKCSHD